MQSLQSLLAAAITLTFASSQVVIAASSGAAKDRNGSATSAITQLNAYAKAGSASEGRRLASQLLAQSEAQGNWQLHLAVADFYRAIGSSAQAIAQYQATIALNPRSADAYYGLARVYLTNSDDLHALKFAQLAYQLEPDSRSKRLAYVDALVRNGDLKKADAELAKLLSDHSSAKDAETNYVAYNLMRKRGKYLMAGQYLDRAMALNPKETQWLSDKADNEESLGLYTNEATTLQHLIASDPYSMAAIKRLGLVFEFYLHDYPAAIAQYRKLLAIDPDYTEALTGIDRCRTKSNDIAGQMKINLWRTLQTLGRN